MKSITVRFVCAAAAGVLLGAGAAACGSVPAPVPAQAAAPADDLTTDMVESTLPGTLLANGGGAGSGTLTAQTDESASAAAQTVASAPAAQPAGPVGDKEYTIGDTGPAGGMVFFDRGNSSGGWRYLEAAPSHREVITRWGSGGRVSGTGIGVGQGKQNTQAIATYMQQKRERGTAAQTCQTLDQGGYTDWFLPSQAELNLLYLNLKKQGLGDFSDNLYWSSSQSSDDSAWSQHFGSGSRTESYSQNGFSVRAIRQF